MSAEPDGLPTLTEVIDIGRWAEPGKEDAPKRPAASPLSSEARIVQDVLNGLQRQIDVMLEYRVREMLGPLLARAMDSVVRDARSELASTLRDVVARAVEAEMARRRER